MAKVHIIAAAGLAAAAFALVAPATANASASVQVSNGSLFVNGSGGADTIFVTGQGGGVFAVTANGISAGAGCTKTGDTSVRCTGVTGTLRIFAGGGNDAVRLRQSNGVQSDVRGGGGEDQLIGSDSGKDFLFGEDGNDTLSGSGTDFLNGGTGFDKCTAVADRTNCEST